MIIKIIVVALVSILFVNLAGCKYDTDKQVELLRNTVEQQSAKIAELQQGNYEIDTYRLYKLQEDCARSAKKYMYEEFNDALTKGNYSYENHYNKKLNACFIKAHYVGYLDNSGKVTDSYLALIDANQNTYLGNYQVHLGVNPNRLEYCQVLTSNCSSESEWEALVKPYMQE